VSLIKKRSLNIGHFFYRFVMVVCKNVLEYIIALVVVKNKVRYQGRIQDFKLGGTDLKKIAPSGGRRENFWGISCEKSRFPAKKLYFLQFYEFYHVKQTAENRRPSNMGDVVTLLFVHFNFIIQFRNMFLFLKSS
jgi:hypothetical protein